MKKLGKYIALLGTMIVVAINGVSAQSPSNTRVAMSDSYTCGVKRFDDYKHSHFSQATRTRGNERINLRSSSPSINHNYHQQAGGPTQSIAKDQLVREKTVPENDHVLRERDYKRMNFI